MEVYVEFNNNTVLFPKVERGIPSSFLFIFLNKDTIETVIRNAIITIIPLR